MSSREQRLADPLAMRSVGMRFGENWVLQDVDLTVTRGSIHAIVGHNGAGKSTLMKIALGSYRPTRGEVWVGGKKLTFSHPAAARELGVGMVLQERSLIPTLNGLDNLFLNSELRNPLRVIQRRRESDQVVALLDQLAIPRSLLSVSASSMSPIEQELIEIAKALLLGSEVLILDEPTAPLGGEEISRLFDLVRTVARRGTGVVLITHHLAEVFAVSDQVTVLREGRTVLSSPTSQTTMPELVAAMLGTAESHEQRGAEGDARGRRGSAQTPQPLLEVKGLHVGTKLSDVSFDVLPGEILGVVGLAGSGRSTLLRTLYGDIRPSAGKLALRGAPYRPRTPRDAIAARVLLIPEQRGVHGLLLQKPIVENVVLSILGRLVSKLRALRMSRGRVVAQAMMSRLDVRARSMDQVVGELSGGNQQKVVLAKALAAGADLLLLDEPTFGVDIGATREIIRHVQTLAERGAGVVWVTSDLLELLQVADRLLVLRDGTVEGFVERGDPDFNQDTLIVRMQRAQFRELATA